MKARGKPYFPNNDALGSMNSMGERRRKRTHFMIYLAGGIAALVTGLVISRLWLAPEVPRTGEAAAPSIIEQPFADLSGTLRNLREWRGKTLLVNFWATWCAPCRAEIPMLQAARERYKQRNFEIIGIAIDDNEAVAAYRDDLTIRYPLLVAVTDPVDLLASFGNDIGALPHSVVLSANGEVLTTHTGPLTAEQLDEMIQDFL